MLIVFFLEKMSTFLAKKISIAAAQVASAAGADVGLG